MTIGNRIQKARKEKGYTQNELAQKLGISVMTIRRFESDTRQPKKDMIEKIASVLEVSAIELMFGSYSQVGITVLNEGYKDLDNKMLQNIEAGKAILNEVKKEKILSAFNKLNGEGQKVAVDRVEELTEIPKYKK